MLDNLSSGSREALRRVTQLANSDVAVSVGDVRSAEALDIAFKALAPDAVIHLAGLKSVSGSKDAPLEYYDHNVTGAIELVKAMQRHGCRHIVFSSSATVYGTAQSVPCDETHTRNPISPYGRTKCFVEDILRDWTQATDGASAVVLRYFNPVGAHPSGRIGEDLRGTPTNLMPRLTEVASGRAKELYIFGDDYDTHDGTGERDFIHVEDLARAHLKAVAHCCTRTGFDDFNVGTGQGATVLGMVRAFEHSTGRSVPYKIRPRREGDVARSIADVGKAARVLGWRAQLGLEDMCRSAWRWQDMTSETSKRL